MRIRVILFTAAVVLVAAIVLAKTLHLPWPWLYSGWPRAIALPETKANTSVDTTVSVAPR